VRRRSISRVVAASFSRRQNPFNSLKRSDYWSGRPSEYRGLTWVLRFGSVFEVGGFEATIVQDIPASDVSMIAGMDMTSSQAHHAAIHAHGGTA
jgi:hypothetical protein